MGKNFSLKGLFVKENEETEIETVKEKPVVSTAKKPTAKPTSLGGSNVSLVDTPVVSVKEQNEFTEFLEKIYEQGNFPGPDYQEYTNALKEVENEPMDEESKFKTIFVGFKVQGVTKLKLIDTGTKYLNLINEQVKGFNSEIDNLLNSEVAGKKTKVDDLTKENNDIELQMRQLTERKNKNNESIQKISQDINEHVSALGVKKASFAAAANDFIEKINTNLEKIRQYLPDAKV